MRHPPITLPAVMKSAIQNKLPATIAALVLVAAAIPVSMPVKAASTGIQRCQSSDGNTVYTDKPCAMFGAEAMPMSAELLTRIAREDAAGSNEIDLYDTYQGPSAGLSVARRSTASGCARSVTQLSMDLQGAMAMGDVNRVAESYHWVGLSNRQGQQIMQRLDDLAAKPLVDAQYYNAQIGSGLQFADASQSAPASTGNAGIMQLVMGQGSLRTVIDLDVERYQGCYFVRF